MSADSRLSDDESGYSKIAGWATYGLACQDMLRATGCTSNGDRGVTYSSGENDIVSTSDTPQLYPQGSLLMYEAEKSHALDEVLLLRIGELNIEVPHQCRQDESQFRIGE
jgi:hypothetical protein